MFGGKVSNGEKSECTGYEIQTSRFMEADNGNYYQSAETRNILILILSLEMI